MNAIIYARVSTQGQAEKGIAIPDQLQKSRQFADESNMQVVAEFTDVESGGTHDRDGFNELELMLARGKADVVIVHESSRLSRNLWEKGLLYEQLKLMGVRLFYSETGEEVDLSDDSFLKRTVDDMMDHEERLRIRKRTIKGRYLKSERGEPVLTGRIPFGYRKVGKGEDAKLAEA